MGFPLFSLFLLLSSMESAAFVQCGNSKTPCREATTHRMAFSNGSGSAQNNNKRRKTVRDRTPQEATSLVQDVIKAAVDAGPRAGPARTLQAYRAFATTAQEFLPKLLSQPSSVSLPAVLRTLFERMGATYVKLGQFIASSPTLFPKEYVVEFQKCLDQTEPLPWSTIKSVIEQELGPISNTFSFVDPKPLASASIAQVHCATLKSTGEQVVIKVQKPGIDASLQADLGFLYVSARVLEFLLPDWERTSLSAVTGDIRASMLEELDFEKEAKNTIEFRRFLQDNGLLKQATAPRVYLDHTTRKVMVLEYLDGISLLDENAISQVTSDPEQGAETILTALNIWSMSLTLMPWFHADVHAGNLLLLKDGRVGFIDFGIVGRISEKVLQSINELSVALAANDSEGMAIALCNMGAADEKVDTKQFGRDIERVLNRMNKVQTDVTVTAMADGTVSGRIDVNESEITDLLLEFVEVTENNGLKLPREFGLLVKQSLYFDRYLKILAPNVDVMNDSRVMIGGRAKEDVSTVNGANDGGRKVIDV
jgi:aarF domain-containing kinase